MTTSSIDIGADVGRRLLAADVLLARLQGEAHGRRPGSVDGDADEASGHAALEGVAGGHVAGVGATEAHGDAEALGAAAAGALALLLWQQRRVSAPLLALHLFKIPSFWRADIMGACSGASLTAMVTFLPVYFQAVYGATAGEAGLMLIPLTAAVASGSVVTGWLISKSGRTAVFPMVGLTVPAVARELARLMNGDISLESTPGKGAQFTVVLPLAKALTGSEES